MQLKSMHMQELPWLILIQLCHGGNETTTNAEPDNFQFFVFVPFRRTPFSVQATSEISRFLFASFDSSIYPTTASNSLLSAVKKTGRTFFLYLMHRGHLSRAALR
jgi:hypothetical protein